MILEPRELAIYNAGERLIPGLTHDYMEVRRHYASYQFFRAVIEADIGSAFHRGGVKIVDLGCGVGHGCHVLSQIPGSQVVGVDCSVESLAFARERYGNSGIEWLHANLEDYVDSMPPADYVVSRNVLEHIPGGLDVGARSAWNARLMIDVPYAEPKGRNPHHVLTNITELDFDCFGGAELLFQDLDGVIYPRALKPTSPNIIVGALRKGSMAPIGDILHGRPFVVDWSQFGAEANPASSGVGDTSVLPARRRRRLAERIARWLRF